MKVDFYASHEHYGHHLHPIWLALPTSVRGAFSTARPHSGAEAVVAGAWRDLQRCSHPIKILVEHGVGQTYSDVPHHTAYGLGPKTGVALWIRPNTRLVSAECETVGVGCPKLDYWYMAPEYAEQIAKVFDVPKEFVHTPHVPLERWGRRRNVVVSFHWPSPVTIESGTALPDFALAVQGLLRNPEFQIWGHAHPRAQSAHKLWEGLRVPTCTFDEALTHADLYVCDNSSTIYEFAAAARKPVLLLNSPRWRRDVEHGIRFWEFADVGVNCDDPDQLEECILDALFSDSSQRAARREAISDELYSFRDGTSSMRASAAILQALEHAKIRR